MSSEQGPVSLTDPDVPTLESYRSLSVLAVFSLLFGLASVIALAAPAAWLIPAAAAVLGWRALHKISRQPSELMGRRLALAGITLGLFFLAAAPSHFVVTRWILQREGQRFVTEWLQAIHDADLNKAHQGVLAVRERQPEGTLLEEYYQRDADESLDRDNFFAEGIYKQLREVAPQARIRFDRTVSVAFTGSSVFVNQRYYLDPDVGTATPLHIQITAIREKDDFGVYWILAAAADAKQVDARNRAR